MIGERWRHLGTLPREFRRPLSRVPVKLYHTTSTNQPIALASELNIKKETQCSVANNRRVRFKRDAGKGSVAFLLYHTYKKHY